MIAAVITGSGHKVFQHGGCKPTLMVGVTGQAATSELSVYMVLTLKKKLTSDSRTLQKHLK